MDFELENEAESGNRRNQMNQEQSRTGSLVDTTDCLEAVSVIKFWKNLLFIIILLALILVQGAFWVTNLNLVKSDNLLLGPAGGGISKESQSATKTGSSLAKSSVSTSTRSK